MRFGYYNFGYGAGAVFLAILVFLLVYVAVNFVCRWNMFIKAGERPWKCLIPVYSEYIVWKMAGIGKEYFRLLIIAASLAVTSLLLAFLGLFGTIVSCILWIVFLTLYIVISIRKCMRLAQCFGQSDTFGLLALFVFSVIGELILAWGNCAYTPPASRPDEEGNFVTGSMIISIFRDIAKGRVIDQ